MLAIALRALLAATAAHAATADGAHAKHSTHAHSARIPPQTRCTMMAMMVCTCCSTTRRITALSMILHAIAMRAPDFAIGDSTRREETLPMACRDPCRVAAPLHATRAKSPQMARRATCARTRHPQAREHVSKDVCQRGCDTRNAPSAKRRPSGRLVGGRPDREAARKK